MKKNSHILIADNNKLMLRTLEAFCKKAFSNFHVHGCDSFDSAIKIIDTKKIAIAITEIVLPFAGEQYSEAGYKLATLARKSHKDAHIFIIGGSDDPEAAQEKAKKVGANAFIQKPFKPHTLLDLINSSK